MPNRTLTIDHRGLADFGQRLVRTSSISGQEGQVAALLAEEMQRVGLTEVRVDRMGNVIGRIGSDAGPVLLFDGHIDTVDIGDRAQWPRDPFGGELQGGVLYGRGAADMKGALAAMVYAAKALCAARIPLAGSLCIAGVVQEEPCEGAAVRHLIEEEGIRPDWVVLGEPTNLHLARGHRGRVEFLVTVRGKACHASTPQRGVNAVYDAARVIVGLELLAPQLGSDAFLGKGSITVTEIASLAGSRNAVPDRCTLYIDRRLTNGETESKALAEVRRVFARESVDATIEVPEYRATSYNGYPLVARQYFPYWATPESDRLVSTAAAAVEQALGFVPHIGRWEFSTDGVYTAGVAGIPTIGFGPGDERHAHTVDEQVTVNDLTAAARVYTQLAMAMLGQKG